MIDPFADRGAYVTVAVAFDRHSVPLVEAAARLALRTGKKLCLAHVVEPWVDLPTSRPFGAVDPLWDVTQAIEVSGRDRARRNLEELKSMLPPGLAVELRVEAGKPPERLAAIAQELASALLVVGVDTGNLRFVPRGFSTALSLMVASPVPVMVVDTAIPGAILGERPRVVLADDLGPACEAATGFALALAAALGNADFRHLHVSGLTFQGLQAGLAMATSASRTATDEGAAEELFDAMQTSLKGRLVERSEPGREYLEGSGGTYTVQVISGSVAEGLGSEVETFSPNLLIFGRHRTYHSKPFFVGRLPFRAMLAYKRPLIIVPSDHEAT